MSDHPRVLLIAPDYPPARGGIQYLLDGIVRHANRVTLEVVALGDARGTTERSGVRTRRIRPRRRREAAVAALNLAAVREGRRFRPDVVLSGHIVVFPAARLIGAPIAQYLYAKEITHRPRLAAFAVRHADANIVLGEHGRALACAAGASRDTLWAIPPGIDVAAAPKTSARDRRPMIATVARLEDRYKGIDVLIRALPLIRSRVPESTLTVVGQGPLRESLQALARANGCAEAIRWFGAATDEERDAVLAQATVFAMPSRLPHGSGGEGFGIVYLEAGAHATPVVAGCEGGAVDAVIHGATGLLVPPESHVEVADAICRLLLDRDLAAELGAGGRRWAEGFAWPRVVSQVEELLIHLAERGR